MAELLFFERPAGLTLAEIVSLTGATARAGAPLDRRITNVAPLDQAGPSDLAFLDRPRFVDDLKATRAEINQDIETLERALGLVEDNST